MSAPSRRRRFPPCPSKTHCQLEGHCSFSDLVAHASEGRWARIAPFRILSLDIECEGQAGRFPIAQEDRVIQIASLVTELGAATPSVRSIFTLGGCSAIAGAQVLSFSDERAMLLKWRDLLLASDPDVVIGYNIANFDLPYLLDRATALSIPAFWTWGRVAGRRVRMRDARFSSKAYGTHEYKEVTVEGRVQYDMLQAIRREHNLSSYSLNAVSAHFLGEQKEDVHHSDIAKLQNGTDETRRRLAVYCLKDAYLPQRLADKLLCLVNAVEMARVTGVPLSFLLTRGQSVKVYSQILRRARQSGMLAPTLAKRGPGGAGGEGGEGYEGATVLDPKAGYYADPIATLDFASLYPSIMMAHNLCYTTLVKGAQGVVAGGSATAGGGAGEGGAGGDPGAGNGRGNGDGRAESPPPSSPPPAPRNLPPGLSPSDVETTPTGEVFVRPSVRQGLLPAILRDLLAARKRAKADMKSATDPFLRSVFNGRQLALKVSANSVYGFTGATVGSWPCLAVSSSVTAYGRRMIEATREAVERRYTRANGYAADAQVVYGDTDSVMVDFGVADVGEAMRLGREAAARVSDAFPSPIRLEFEKVYRPYLLVSKKRYAGLLWTDPAAPDKIDAKGIETVRRDNCALVRNVVGECLRLILRERDPERAVAFAKRTIADLLRNKLDLSLLVVSKGLTTDPDAWTGPKSAHVELAKKMRRRDPATAPQVGDRVAYVIVKAAKGAKAYEKAEDPLYALEHSLPVDTQHYLDHHLAQPLLRIFEPLLKNPEKELLAGEHTRTISLATPSAAAGGIARFAKVRPTCLGCRAQLAPPAKGAPAGQQQALCPHCLPRAAEIYAGLAATVAAAEGLHDALWTECQRCQGSLHQDVLCASRDCPIFYRRTKVKNDLREAQGNQIGRAHV